MKKKLVTYLLISALAVTVFAGCSKKDEAAGDAAASGDAVATEVTEETEEVVEEAGDAVEETGEAVEAAGEDVAVMADTAAEAALAEAIEAADTAEAAVEAADEEAEEYVEETAEEAAEAVTGEVAAEDVLIVDPGTQYVVRFGGNVYSSPEENDANIQYFANPGDTLNVVERLDDYWYKVTYWLAGEGIEHEGYIQIQ